jgi:hypothetical protein
MVTGVARVTSRKIGGRRWRNPGGNVKADIMDRSVPGFKRANFVDIIDNSDWPE